MKNLRITWKNILLVTYDGKIWYLSLYDLDTSWGSNWNGSQLLNYNEVINIKTNQLWNKLIKNYPNELADRYIELRESIFTKDYVMDKFTNFVKTIPDNVYNKENKKWKDIPGFDITQINDFLEIRIPLLDEFFNNMYTEENTVYVVYEKNFDNSITVKLVSNNKNFMCIGDCSYTYKKDGNYTLYYSDYSNTLKSIETSVSNIIYIEKKMLRY